MKRCILALMLIASSAPAFATGLIPKSQNVLWSRNGVAYNLANGVRDNVAGVGPAATTRDTSGAIDVRDHWSAARRVYNNGPNGGVAGALVQDTIGIFGTLSLKSTKESLDSINIVRQISTDGTRWTTVDSIGGHVVVADTLWNASSAVTDTVRALNLPPAILLPNGIANRIVNYSWNCNPWYAPNAITSMATVGVNYIRFIITMSHGDYVAAGLNDGWTGTFSYLAIKP